MKVAHRRLSYKNLIGIINAGKITKEK